MYTVHVLLNATHQVLRTFVQLQTLVDQCLGNSTGGLWSYCNNGVWTLSLPVRTLYEWCWGILCTSLAALWSSLVLALVGTPLLHQKDWLAEWWVWLLTCCNKKQCSYINICMQSYNMCTNRTAWQCRNVATVCSLRGSPQPEKKIGRGTVLFHCLWTV